MSMVSSQHAVDVDRNRHILRKIIEVIVLCGKQNIPIRGHTESKSNFSAILNAFAKEDRVLAEHLAFGDSRAKYTSPDVQNELIDICAKQIQDSIVNDCAKASCFAIIADEATDKATKEQVSLCVRFVDSSDTPTVREEFIAFIGTDSIKAEALARIIVSTIENTGLNINKLRAQCYDGAANMAGKRSGVQARIRQIVPLANYVHCKAHCLNLALVHSSKEISVRTMMATVQEVSFAFDYSSKRLAAFGEELSTDADTREKMQRRSKLRTLCETRWSSRADALFTFKTAFPVVVSALESLQGDGDVKAGQHLASILRFEFIIALVTAEHILSSTVALTTFLQKTDCDMIEAISESKIAIQRLTDGRNDPLVWPALYETAVNIAAPFDIQPCVPRGAGRQQHRANYPIDSPVDYWRVALFYTFTDHLVEEISVRLLQNESRYSAESLLPTKLNGLTVAVENTIYEAYGDDLQTRQVFDDEITRWKVRWRMADEKPGRLVDVLHVTNKDLYPSIHTILSILLTMPPSSATAERSFSAMRRIKNFLRATMCDSRLSSLAIMHVHRDMDIDVEMVLQTFVTAKGRRLDFL